MPGPRSGGQRKVLNAALLLAFVFGAWLYLIRSNASPTTSSAPNTRPGTAKLAKVFLNSTNCSSIPCFFDATNLTAQDDRHVERLLRLEEDLASMRDFLVRRMVPPAAANDNSSREEMWELKPSAPVYNNTGDLVRGYTRNNVDRRHTRLMLFRALEYLWVMEFDVAVIKETDAAVRSATDKLRMASHIVRLTLEHLQNPVNCSTVPKLRCRLNNPGSLGSGLHDLLWCLVAGLQTGRMVVLDSAGWKHTSGTNEWSNAFLPLVEPACEQATGANGNIIDGYPTNGSIFAEERRSIVDLPGALVPTLVASHGDPYAWWFGHLMAYILRPSSATKSAIEEIKQQQDYQNPIVGVHIDGFGKWDLVMQNVADCMRIAEEFYAKMSLKENVMNRRVFVDTNRPEVLSLIRAKYPKYTVISNGPVRSSPVQNLATMAVNVHLLAQADRLVCGFSSAWCRVAYELMQGVRAMEGGDATRLAFSVDVPYSYAGVPFPPRRARYPNNQVLLDDELSWGLNDLAWIQEEALPAGGSPVAGGRKNDGFPEGVLLQSTKTKGNTTSSDQRRGIYPRFKTIQVFSVAPYAIFDSVLQAMK